MNTIIFNLKHGIIIIVLLLFLPLSGIAQKKVYSMVIEKRDGTEVSFFIDKDLYFTPRMPLNVYKGYDITTFSRDEIKRIFVRDTMVDYGDVTCSGSVNVQDATIVINYILGEVSNDYAYMVADMNDDNVIDVFDVTAMINVILSRNDNSALSRSQRLQEESKESIILTASNNGILFDIDNAERFTSFQFDVEVPQGADLMGVEWNGNSHHVLQFEQTGNNRYTVIALSMSNEPLHDFTERMLRLRLSEATSGEVSVNNVLFVTPQGKATYFRGQTLGVTTDIHGVIHSSEDNVYDLSGRRLIKNRNQLNKGFYLINKKKVVINK